MKLLRFVLICTTLFFIINLHAQDELVTIGTWDMQEDIILKCENNNQGGSDLNNDGYDDYILATWDNFYFFMGGNDLNTTYDFVLDGPSSSGCVSWGGDINGDGYKDIVFSRAVDAFDPGDVYICLGGEEIDVEPELILQGEDYILDPVALNYHGYNGGYDFNGDGYDDLLTWGDGPSLWWNGLIQIFFGGDELSTEPDFQIQGGIEEFFGHYWAVCDINGDGYDDLIASRNNFIEEPVTFELYLGGENMDAICDYELVDECWGSEDCYTIGDFNGDGIEEFFVYIGTNGAIGSFYINSLDELVFQQIYLDMPGYIRSVDINGDEYREIMSWVVTDNVMAVYYVNANYEFEFDIMQSVPEITYYQDYAKFYCQMGDVNGDGEAEIIVNNAEAGLLSTTATIYGLPGNSSEETVIENGKWKMENYPNPFNPTTTISYELPEGSSNPVIEIYNIKGERVRELRIKDEGLRINSVVWDGTDNYRNQVSSGVYIASVKSQNHTLSKKMILLK